MASIHLDRVSVRLHGEGQTIQALDDVSLRVRSGEVMGIIGPTGCGKTTLLRAVAGLVRLEAGTIYIDDQDQASVPAGQRGLGMVFQHYALFPHWSVWDNLAFYFRLRRREEEVPQRVRDAADILGVDLSLLLKRRPRQLSMGQRQQVAVARCLIRDPRIFLMDEPFANLDAKQRGLARLQVKRLLNRFQVTTLHVTHDQLEASALCDRLAVLIQGRLLQVDTYAHLLQWPATWTVAQFVSPPGTAFVAGAMLDGHFASPSLAAPLLPHVLVRIGVGQGLVLGVPPHAVSLAEPGRLEAVAAAVTAIERLPLQRQQRASCQVGAEFLTLELPIDYPLHVGETVRLRLDPENLQVFDQPSGVNLALRPVPSGSS